MSIIDDLITDRTESDVNRVHELARKWVDGEWTGTTSELSEWYSGMKGAYNATDLNRVNAAMEYLEARFKAMGYTGGYYQRVKVPHDGSSVEDENTLLLIHGDSVSDASTYSVPITNGGVSVSSAQGKFGASSLYFNGSSAITISMDDIGLDFNGDWTLEWWEYTTAAASTASAIFCMPNGANGFVSYSPSSGNVRLFAGNGAWGFIAVSTIGTFIQGEWTHRAICKSGTTVYAFENGELFTTLQTSGSLTQTDTLYIGYRATTSYSGYYTGYLDEIRVSNIARWTSSFTPPTERYSATTVGENTELDPYTWYKEDIPREETMGAYLANVQRLRDALGALPTTPQVPDSMETSTIQEWNDIETILIDVETVINALLSVFQRAGMPWAVAGNNIYIKN